MVVTYLGLLFVGLHVVMVVSIQALRQGKTVMLSGYKSKTDHVVVNDQSAATVESRLSPTRHHAQLSEHLDNRMASDGPDNP